MPRSTKATVSRSDGVSPPAVLAIVMLVLSLQTGCGRTNVTAAAQIEKPTRRAIVAAAKTCDASLAPSEAPEPMREAKQDGGNRLRTWKEAASTGMPEAQYLLGLCAKFGVAPELDGEDMAPWLRKAAEQGYAPARSVLGCHLLTTGSEDRERTRKG